MGMLAAISDQHATAASKLMAPGPTVRSPLSWARKPRALLLV